MKIRITGRLRAAAGLVAGMILAGATAQAAETVLVAAGSSMTWRANSADPGLGITWTAEAFTPSGWSSGSYGVGYDGTSTPNALALIASTAPSGSNSVYTRATFTIADVSAVNNLFLGADWDDGYIAWINGVEVYRSAQMPSGTPAWNTPAGLHESSNGTSPNYGTLVDISAAGLSALHNGTNVLAVGVWNSTLPSSDLVVVPKLSMNRDTAVTRGPYLQRGTPDSVVVRWRTTASSDSCVRYGAAPGSLTSIACVGTATTEHVVSVTGLAADTKYYYSVGTSTVTQAGNSSDFFFVTSPPAGTPKATRMWVLGDSGTKDANQAAVRDGYFAMAGTTPTDLWLMLGDNAYNTGTDSEYQAAVFDMYPTVLRNSVLWPTLGNHDGANADSATQSGPYYSNFTLPNAGQAGGVSSGTEAYYSFDYGDIHFICLESYETDRSAGGAMMTWLAADLADTTANWIIAFFHHPPYSKGSHNSDTETELKEMRQNALPILEAGGVDLVLSGHSHSYERSYLLDGHYGLSGTLTSAMKLDPGDGRDSGTGPYLKPGGGPASHEGAVYAVAGSSGQVDTGSLNHPAMYVSMATLGSMVIDVDGDRLEARFIDSSGTTQDQFTIEKVPPLPVCGNGTVEAGEECDDGNASNTDACLNSCVAATCGDGVVRTGVEQCDDANTSNTDACLATCLTATCGDGFVRAGFEQCDDANASDTDACLGTCVAATCGDGFVRAGVEQCDDANASNTDACLDTCLTATCGDGFVRAGVEQCDDANAVNTDACLSSCVPATCGDGVVRTGFEQCDDANASNTDACLTTCAAATCGDGFVRTGVEQCDDANASNTDACPDTCITASCGDGFVRAGVEECDDANASDTDACLGTCIAATCGDGFVRAGVEQCDDGNASNTDACLGTCIAATCGDGFVRAGVEQCDDANASDTDACLGTCIAATCGDGSVHVGVEQCDDANANDADGCLSTCVLTSCGDGVVHPLTEECDDGNLDNTDACLNTCQDAACGDGIVRAGVEQCDDANGIDTDACRNSCAAATCGDGVVQAGVEQCDDGNAVDTDACRNSCVAAICGDGIVQAAVEQCDDGNAIDTDACLATCVAAACGDGFTRAGVEQCDDGNASNSDACLATCVAAACGDGFIRAGVEQCDDGNAVNTDACLDTCVAAACGDGFTRTGVEQCDDGNAVNTDACLATCVAATCGDGFSRTGVEQCDDGNAVDADACLGSCVIASCGDGIVHAGVEQCDDGNASDTDACLGTCLPASCGDGHVRAGLEQCDDGNLDATDACTATCTAAACGDGVVRAGFEECDDGNVAPGDGCSVDCLRSCSAAPRIDCATAALSTIRVASFSDPSRNSLKWQWQRGPAIVAADLGNPAVDGAYNLCLYPNVPGAGGLGAEVLLPSGAPWVSGGERGFSYQDLTGAVSGISDIRISAGEAGRTKVKVRGRGANLPAGMLPATSYTVQLVDVAGGGCWSSEFSSGDSTATAFKGRSQVP